MKRLLSGIIALLLCLCGLGCQRQQVTETEPEQTLQVTLAPSIPTEETFRETQSETEPLDTDFVAVRDFIPDIVVELKYATLDNFTGQVIYDFQEAYLRYGTVKKLMAVQMELREQKLSLKIWDGFRPAAAQFRLWEVCPDPKYVANPNNGFSGHTRGNTVDVTLVDENGAEITMPTGFDDFSELADRDYSDCSFDIQLNVLLLEQTMERHGFSGYKGEWWHFTDTDAYAVEEAFVPAK